MKIVIIDDHQIIIEGLEMLLGFEKNMQIQKTYNDAYVFLEELHSGTVKPDVLLMDLMMPTINGLECSKILKKEFPDIKIIILSLAL